MMKSSRPSENIYAAVNSRILQTLWLCASVFAAAMLLFAPSAAFAQTSQYTNSVDAVLNENTTSCSPGNYLVRQFTVGPEGNSAITDVNIGVLIGHTYRGDLLMYLTSPEGTTVQIFNGTGAGSDNFNVLLDDAIGSSVSGHSANDTAAAGTSVPPYQRNFSSFEALGAFNGEISHGTWTLEMCDRFNQDSGNFYQADLYVTGTPTNYADLSLTKNVSNSTPTNGSSIFYTLQVTNAAISPQTASGVIVSDVLPAGFTYVSSSGFGTYNSATGDWTVGSVAPGQTRTMTINGTVNATSGATVTNSAEITASSQVDIDSTVVPGPTNEDDDDTASFTVSGTRVAGTPPNFNAVCSPANQIVFDWNGKSWVNGAGGGYDNFYTIAGIGTVQYGITTDDPFVSGSPTLNTTNTGGFGPTEQSLFLNMNNDQQSDASTTTVTLQTAVPGLQFHLFDVDFGSGTNGWADKVTVTGTYNGATVLPILTNNIANYVVGNTVIGDAGSSGDQVNGNVVVTFMSPVDSVTFVYSNHTTAPINPGNQFMNIYDFRYCQPDTTLSVTKISNVVNDPVNGSTNPKAIPGAIINYCILISNAGSATVNSIVATDNIPAHLTYTPGSMQSGANCGSAATAEDDNTTDGDESDPFGASISGTALTATATSLGPAEAYALTFQVTVD